MRTDRGRPVAAELRWTGPVATPVGQTDDTGRTTTALRPGRWQLLVSAPGLGSRKVDLDLRGGEGVEPVAVELAEPKVEVTASAVVIRQQIQFEFNDDTIRAESAALLDEVAAVLLLHPAIRVEIQGHTDNRGSDAYNLDLSDRGTSFKLNGEAAGDLLHQLDIEAFELAVLDELEGRKGEVAPDSDDALLLEAKALIGRRHLILLVVSVTGFRNVLGAARHRHGEDQHDERMQPHRAAPSPRRGG